MASASALKPEGSMRSVEIIPDFDAIEKFIKQNEGIKTKVAAGMDLLIRTIATITLAYARQKSLGPVAPGRRSVPALAYRIPVQRITGDYYAGWKIRRVSLGSWLVYNDSKEAYLIETGLYQRVRRPILKMSVIATLKFIEGTETAKRFLEEIIRPDGKPGAAVMALGSEYTELINGTSTRSMTGAARRPPVTRIVRRKF